MVNYGMVWVNYGMVWVNYGMVWVNYERTMGKLWYAMVCYG